MKRKIVKWDEIDLSSRYWRRRLCYMQRAGASTRIKRRISRRERRNLSAELRRER